MQCASRAHGGGFYQSVDIVGGMLARTTPAPGRAGDAMGQKIRGTMATSELSAAGKSSAPPIERVNRDQKVVRAAIEIMSQKGYAAMSLQEVAERVGILKGSLYYYFSSKEELLFRILQESHEQAQQIARDVAALHLPPLDELLEYLRRSSTWYLANVDRANIFFTEARNLNGERADQARGWGRAFETHVQSLVTAGQENGSIRADLDLRLITRYIMGAVNNIRFWPTRSGKSFSVSEISAALVELVRTAIVAG
jgi:AcrR family transcriptional regulator